MDAKIKEQIIKGSCQNFHDFYLLQGIERGLMVAAFEELDNKENVAFLADKFATLSFDYKELIAENADVNLLIEWWKAEVKTPLFAQLFTEICINNSKTDL